MTVLSKIKIFFIIFTIALISCSKKNDVIPDVTVDFTLNINDPEFTNLYAIGGSVLIDSRTNNWGRYAAGFGGNGIIVTCGVDEFYAYDRTCPYDYVLSGTQVKVVFDTVGFAKAICPECGTTYELLSFGTPAAGPGKYPLKNYKTSFDGTYVRVWNNY